MAQLPRRLSLLLVISATFCAWADSVSAQEPIAPAVALGSDPRVAWLKEHSARIRSVNPTDTDFSDLEPFRKAVGDARVVMLGEQTHGDGTTFLAKTRLIKFLHERMGFDVFAWEAALYDMSKSWELIQRGEHAATSMERAGLGTWTFLQEIQPLIAYIESQARTRTPLQLTGFDINTVGRNSRDFLGFDLRLFLDRLGIRTDALDESSPFRKALAWDASSTETTALEAMAVLRKEVATKAGERPTAETSFWQRVLSNITETWKVQLNRALVPKDPGTGALQYDTPEWVRVRNIRDIEMGKNLVWLARERFANRKIIVWGATSHLLYDFPDPDQGKGYVTMGRVVRDALGDKVFGLGFTAYSGFSWLLGDSPHPVQRLEGVTGFEELMHQTGYSYALLDLRSAKSGGLWAHDRLHARPMGNEPAAGDWPSYLDALFYMQELKPASWARQ